LRRWRGTGASVCSQQRLPRWQQQCAACLPAISPLTYRLLLRAGPVPSYACRWHALGWRVGAAGPVSCLSLLSAILLHLKGPYFHSSLSTPRFLLRNAARAFCLYLFTFSCLPLAGSFGATRGAGGAFQNAAAGGAATSFPDGRFAGDWAANIARSAARTVAAPSPCRAILCHCGGAAALPLRCCALAGRILLPVVRVLRFRDGLGVVPNIALRRYGCYREHISRRRLYASLWTTRCAAGLAGSGVRFVGFVALVCCGDYNGTLADGIRLTLPVDTCTVFLQWRRGRTAGLPNCPCDMPGGIAVCVVRDTVGTFRGIDVCHRGLTAFC